MKYLVGIFIFVAGFIGASASMGSLPSFGNDTSYYIDFETATDQEREAWLKNEAGNIERGIGSALPKKTSGKKIGMRVTGSRINVEQRRIDVDVRMVSYGVMFMSQTDARKQFTKKTCPVYKRSALKDASIVLEITIRDPRGGKLITFLNSPLKCDRFA